jgi:catalase
MAAAAVKNAAQSGESKQIHTIPLIPLLTSVLNSTVGDAKTRQMESFTQHQDKNTPLTTYFGTKMAETDVALRAGARGPTVLEGMSLFSISLLPHPSASFSDALDFHNREKISHFDHERIP